MVVYATVAFLVLANYIMLAVVSIGGLLKVKTLVESPGDTPYVDLNYNLLIKCSLIPGVQLGVLLLVLIVLIMYPINKFSDWLQKLLFS